MNSWEFKGAKIENTPTLISSQFASFFPSIIGGTKTFNLVFDFGYYFLRDLLKRRDAPQLKIHQNVQQTNIKIGSESETECWGVKFRICGRNCLTNKGDTIMNINY